MNHENVISELNSIMLSIPKDADLLEKIRYVYIKTGEVFSYDYYYLENQEEYKVRFEDDYIDRYSTCSEISQVLALMISNIDRENIKCEVINRPKTIIREGEENTHIANLVTLSTGEKFILDLTLDLHLIQSGCRTMEFGYTTMFGDEDIISLRECEKIDRKLGLIKFGEYTDEKINRISKELMNIDFSDMSFEEEIKTKIEYLNSLMVNFRSLHEGKNYIKTLFSRLLKCNYKEFNLRGNNEMIGVYLIPGHYGEQVWYVYTLNKPLTKTSPEEIFNMLHNGWNSKSVSLDDVIEDCLTR